MSEINLVAIKNEINTRIADKEVFAALVTTTFKGLEPQIMKRALMEGMMRGFTFQNFLQKDVYALPFKGEYALVTSIDYSRKVGARSGVVGKDEPIYETKVNAKGGEDLVACSVTIKKKTGDTIGDFTAKVYFSEYSTGKNQWASKPRTMIAKVAEMHALRMACPEELAKAYVEEEFEKSAEKPKAPPVDLASLKRKLDEAKDMASLGVVWSSLPIEAKNALKDFKDEIKVKKFGFVAPK